MATLDDLLKPMTSDEALEMFLTELEAIGVPARKWRKAGSMRTTLRVIAIGYAGFSTLMTDALAGLFLEKAAGSFLILLAKFMYGVEALTATFAAGSLRLINAGGGLYEFEAREAQFRNIFTGRVYRNVNAFSLAPGATLSIYIESLDKGSIANATPGQIIEIVSSMLNVTCFNSAAVVGRDTEKDPDLRERCLAKLATLSVRGPRDAYKYAVISALRLDGTPVNLNRASVHAVDGTGAVSVRVAAPSGPPAATDITAAAASIETIARPDGVLVNVAAASTLVYTANITVYLKGVSAGFSDLEAISASAVSDFISKYRIGGLVHPQTGVRGLFGSGITSAIAKVLQGYEIDSITGAVDLVMTSNDVASDAVSVTCLGIN